MGLLRRAPGVPPRSLVRGPVSLVRGLVPLVYGSPSLFTTTDTERENI